MAYTNPGLHLVGKRYRLMRDSLAIHLEGADLCAVRIPANSSVKVVSIDGGGLIDILWKGEMVSMFKQDLLARGAEIAEKTVGA